jgi:ferredoxin-type protein NapH
MEMTMRRRPARQKIRKALIMISFLLFPATFFYFSPYLVIAATLQGIIAGSMLMFALQFVSGLFLGRAFCGWVCPAGGAQEPITEINNRPLKSGKWVKWLIWIPWIGLIVVLAFNSGGYHTIDPLYKTTMGLSIGHVGNLITYFLVLLLIVLPALLIGRRSFCHHLCWMAPFMIIARRISGILRGPALQLAANPQACSHCAACGSHCPMSLPVPAMVQSGKLENSDCILCGTCVDGCESGALKFAFKRLNSTLQLHRNGKEL